MIASTVVTSFVTTVDSQSIRWNGEWVRLTIAAMMQDEVRNWLEKQGYPLEMRAASLFKQAGFEVRQSWYYPDAETGKSRELDILVRDPDFIGIVDIEFAIECKAIKKPWLVLSTSETVSYNRAFSFAITSEAARRFVCSPERIHWFLDNLAWFSKDDLTGYSLRQSFSDGQEDIPYATGMSVLKAAHCRLEKAPRPKCPKFQFIFPVIVIDSPLLRCWLGGNGQLEMQEVSEGEYLFDPANSNIRGTAIRVVTLSGLPKFVKTAKFVAEQVRAYLKPEVDRFMKL
ncbi:MAG TPA: hypothetical protein VN577_24310 [Terriglobales bacterium]|nr:hypothetical protein [Terriglobales bacterium]